MHPRFFIFCAGVALLASCALPAKRPLAKSRATPPPPPVSAPGALTSPACTVAPYFDLRLSRPVALGRFVLCHRIETYPIGLSFNPDGSALGLLTFDADTAFVPVASEFVPLTPGLSTTRTRYDLRPLGGYVTVALHGPTANLAVHYRRPVGFTTAPTGVRVPRFAEFDRTASVLLSPQPTVLAGDGVAVTSYTFVYHP